MLCSFLLCSKVNQPSVYTYPLFFGSPSHLGHHRAQSRVLSAGQQVLICYLLFLMVIYSYYLFWLYWVFVAARSLLQLQGVGSLVVALGVSCPSACGILVRRPGIKPALDSLPPDHQGSPQLSVSHIVSIVCVWSIPMSQFIPSTLFPSASIRLFSMMNTARLKNQSRKEKCSHDKTSNTSAEWEKFMD